MTNLFPSLPEDAGLAEVFRAFPDTIAPLLAYHDRLLRGPGELPVADRELIAAYVSGLNACSFCLDAHVIFAQAYGVAPDTIAALLEDVDTAPVAPALKPLLAYVAQLTRAPSRMTGDLASAVYDAGWSEAALFEAVQVCGLFNLMNRILEGTGVAEYPAELKSPDAAGLERRRSDTAYTDYGRFLGIMDS